MSKTRSIGDGLDEGPIEHGQWPEKLTARVVTPGKQPRIHGYDVQTDLARHYSAIETSLLALTGELADEQRAAALDVALTFMAPAPVNQAPTHAGLVARLAGASDSAIVAVGALTLAEQAAELVDRHALLLDWLDGGTGAPPERSLATSEPDRRAVERLVLALGERGLSIVALDADLGLEAALLAVLHHAGLQTRAALTLSFTLARLPCLVAEAQAARPGDFAGYPMRLPDFVYQEDEP